MGDPGDFDLAALSLSLQTRNALRRQGIQTVRQLCRRSRDELLGLRALGPRRLGEIETALSAAGLALGDADRPSKLPMMAAKRVRPVALVVDPHPDGSRALAALAEQEGFSVRTARSTDRALAIAEFDRPVVTILVAPRSLAACRRLIRALRQRSGGRIFVIGPWTLPQPQLARLLNADATLARPLDPEELRVQLRRSGQWGVGGGQSPRSAAGGQ